MPKLTQRQMMQRREHITKAAMRCFARSGFHATTIPDICTEADISFGGLYTHFASKEEIVEAAVQTAGVGRKKTMDQALQQSRGLHDLTEIDEILTLLLDSDQGREMCQLEVNFWSEAIRSQRLGDLARISFKETLDGLSALAAQSRTAGPYHPEFDPDTAATIVYCVILGAQVLRATGVSLPVDTFIEAFRILRTQINHTSPEGKEQ